MACTCVVGLQWGDEAKGKIVDLLTAQHDLVIGIEAVTLAELTGGVIDSHTSL